MPKVWIDGQEFDVPEGLTGRELKERARKDPDDILYRAREDQHEVIEDEKPVRLQEGERLGTVRPFLTGGDPQEGRPGQTEALATRHRVSINRKALDIPPFLTVREAKAMAGIDPQDILVQVIEGECRILDEDEPVPDGAQMISVPPFLICYRRRICVTIPGSTPS